MTYQELVTQVKKLPLNQQLSLLETLNHLIQESIDPPPRAENSLARVRGMLKPQNQPTPTDTTLAADYTDYLIQKYS